MALTSSIDKITKELTREGLTFKEFSFVQEGNYTPSDADWNYKDVPHLHHIHKLVEAVITNVSDDYIATINVQKVFGIKVPLPVFNYAINKNRQLYYTSLLFYTLIIESSYEELTPCRTRVTTRYCIGSSRFWMLFFPLLKWTLRRNYDDLMSGDIPMRERRGQLRNWGYRFKGDSGAYSFRKTMEIFEKNVLLPEAAPSGTEKLELSSILPQDGTFYWGREDHLGLRIIREGNEIRVYPRMCPHEGADLDKSSCIDKKIHCPWHGRVFTPLAEFKLGGREPIAAQTGSHGFSLSADGVFDITPLKTNFP